MTTTRSPGFTLEQLGSIYPVLEDVPASFDDPQWAGGAEVFGAFTSSNMLASFTGSKKRAVMETPEASVFPGERAKRVKVRALANGGDAQIILGRREHQTATRTYSPEASPNSRTGLASFSNDAGRYHTAQVIKSDQDWTEAQGAYFEAQRAGRK